MGFKWKDRPRLSRFAFLAMLAAWPSVSRAQDGFRLIVHSTNPVTMFRVSGISKLFLRKQTRWPNGQVVQPVDQAESSPVRRRFSPAIHRMDVPSVQSFWQEMVFSGRDEPPPECASDAAVIAYVRAHPNAVGYIGDTTPAESVRVITVIQ